MKNLTEKGWGLLVMMIVSLIMMVHVSCSVTKGVETKTEKCDKDKKECCSKK